MGTRKFKGEFPCRVKYFSASEVRYQNAGKLLDLGTTIHFILSKILIISTI